MNQEDQSRRPGHEPLAVNDAPPERVGNLLAMARTRRGLTLEEVSAALSRKLSMHDVLSIEEGRMRVQPSRFRELSELYGIDPDALVPPRSQLILDLNEGFIRAGDDMALLSDDAGSDQVLRRYLHLVYRMRAAEPSEVLALRHADIDALASALKIPSAEVAEALRSLMGEVSQDEGLRRRRNAILLGIAIAAVAALALAWAALSGDGSSGSQPTTPPVSTTTTVPDAAGSPVQTSAVSSTPGAPTTAVAPTGAEQQPTAVLGPPAIVQERQPDGSPGEQTDR